MNPMLLVAALLALIWGVLWGLALQFTRPGRFLAAKRTWIAVAVGVGVDLAIMLVVVPLDAWLAVILVFAASAVPIVTRSLINEWAETEALLERRD